jgi:hypothetical protein
LNRPSDDAAVAASTRGDENAPRKREGQNEAVVVVSVLADEVRASGRRPHRLRLASGRLSEPRDDMRDRAVELARASRARRIHELDVLLRRRYELHGAGLEETEERDANDAQR